MPLPDGTMTEDEFRLVATKLLTFWGANGGRKPCRSCGDDAFLIHPALLANASDTVSFGGPHTRMPTVMVYCRQCGYAEHYVARVLGIEALKVNV
jgi:ribosomal protein L37E